MLITTPRIFQQGNIEHLTHSNLSLTQCSPYLLYQSLHSSPHSPFTPLSLILHPLGVFHSDNPLPSRSVPSLPFFPHLNDPSHQCSFTQYPGSKQPRIAHVQDQVITVSPSPSVTLKPKGHRHLDSLHPVYPHDEYPIIFMRILFQCIHQSYYLDKGVASQQ